MATAPMVDELVAETVAAVRALPVKSAAPMRAVRVALSRKLRKAAPAEVIAAAHRLKSHGLDWMGWELIYAHKPTLKSLDVATVEATMPISSAGQKAMTSGGGARRLSRPPGSTTSRAAVAGMLRAPLPLSKC